MSKRDLLYPAIRQIEFFTKSVVLNIYIGQGRDCNRVESEILPVESAMESLLVETTIAISTGRISTPTSRDYDQSFYWLNLRLYQ